MLRVIVTVLLVALCSAQPSKPIVNNSNYTWYCSGNCETPALSIKEPEFGIVLMGGGTDVDEAFIWMANKASGGDFLILRTSGDGAYDEYILELSLQATYPLNSVSTLVLKSRAASFDDFVVEKTQNASALWFAGGDQWTYYSYWKGSPLHDVFMKPKYYTTRPIGGTSAGNAIQGEFVYTAEFDSAYSFESLRDPYNKFIQIGTDFLPDNYLLSLITDTHFYERDRMGRLVAFVSRLATDSFASMPPNLGSTYANCYDPRYGARGIGVDEATALLIDSDFTASLVSWDPNGSAYLLCLDHLPQTCAPGENLVVEDVSVIRFSGNVSSCFDWNHWQVLNNLASSVYSLSASGGSLTSTQPGGDIY